MTHRKLKQDRFRLLVARKRQGLRLKDLESMIDHDASTIGKAINHGRYPRVIKKLKEVLRV